MIKIAHLYYDIMNLYGENGNIRALKEQKRNKKIYRKRKIFLYDGKRL